MDDQQHRLPVIKVRVESQHRKAIRLPKLLRQEMGRSTTETPTSPSHAGPFSPGRGSGHTRLSPVRLSIDAIEQPEVWIPSMRPGVTKKSSPRKLSLHRDCDSWGDCNSHYREYHPQFPAAKLTLRQFKGQKRIKDWHRPQRSKRTTSRTPLLATLNISVRDDPGRHGKTRSVSSQENAVESLPVAIARGIRIRSPRLRAPLW